MRKVGSDVVYSATDLANHLGCTRISELETLALRGDLDRPYFHDLSLEALQQRGYAHEDAYIAHLKSRGHARVVDLREIEGDGVDKTLAAMKDGADVIAQATLQGGNWGGRADFLVRVETPSSLGKWSYVVLDTKLSQHTRGGTILQLCVYSEIVAGIQEREPTVAWVVTPAAEVETDFDEKSYRLDDFWAYYRQIKSEFEARCEAVSNTAETYPEPCEQCRICRWWPDCDQRRRADDHLCLVAGSTRRQRTELVKMEFATLEALGSRDKPIEQKPSRGSLHTYERLRGQARVQLQGRQQARPVHELLDRAPERGLALLPEPDLGDVYFDFEGDPFVGRGGLEYLFGYCVLEDGELVYHSTNPLNLTEEKQAFESFIGWLMQRWKERPGLHVYHYGHKESSTFRRLMSRHATCEDEVDKLLRAGVFVDLYRVVKQSVRASVERYSIKDLEPFFGFERQAELDDVRGAIRAVEYGLEVGKIHYATDEQWQLVKLYNREDCTSAYGLHMWLEGLRQELVDAGETIERLAVKDGEPSEQFTEYRQRIAELMDKLLENIPEMPEDRTADQQCQWLLAQLLDFHRREGKVEAWEKFRILELNTEDLISERAAIGSLKFEGDVGTSARSTLYKFSFPPQEVDFKLGDYVRDLEDKNVGRVESIDPDGSIVLKTTQNLEVNAPDAVFQLRTVSSKTLDQALQRIATWVIGNEIDGDGPYRAGRDLLLRRPPRAEGGVAPDNGQAPQDTAVELAIRLDGGVLPVQGPPGAGKTRTGARIIAELVSKHGHKIGVCANSHQVIQHLLEGAAAYAEEQGLSLRIAHKDSPPDGKKSDSVAYVPDAKEAAQMVLGDQVDVMGGTAWLWVREELFEAIDTLIIDEAGQLSLPKALAAAQAAKNVILLGDPQQLEQPIKGTHPDGSDVPALQHLLGDNQTVPPDRGVFLDTTWRLHPSICEYTSKLFYDSRLVAKDTCSNQAVAGETSLAGAGLWHMLVEHEGNQGRSDEEVAEVHGLFEHLTSGAVKWVDFAGETRPVRAQDILIVTPYNRQLAALRAAIPDARIGTVDKFQGQQAPIVIYTMATSSAEDAPRGMGFVYNRHRLNVATSRARCACILIAAPTLMRPACRTPEQMRLANGFATYLEMSRAMEL